MRLSGKTVRRLPPDVDRYRYKRMQQRGIVHLGIGAFMRAHLSAYTDDALNDGDADWLTTGVSLRSPSAHDQLSPQDGLYMIAEKSGAGTAYRVVGSVRDVLVAPETPEAVISAIADPAARLVTLTVTEKGYCRTPDGELDFSARTLAHDLKGPEIPQTIYGFICAGLARRRATGLGGLSLVSCDNLAANGEVLHLMMAQFLTRYDANLGEWFERECTCPSTMVDRIVPAATEADRDTAQAATGLRDEGLVVTEPFRQWVIEDRFSSGHPSWEAGGAQFVTDVAPFETAKLRMLNGAHSALAYLGLGKGHQFVHQAVGDPAIRPQVERLMRLEAAPTIDTAPGQNLDAYADALLTRFENPVLEHRLSQIAMDGSQKVPQRWLATLAEQQRRGKRCPAILDALGAWLQHVRGDNGPVDDPLAGELKRRWNEAGEAGIVEAVFGSAGLLPSAWSPSAGERAAMLG